MARRRVRKRLKALFGRRIGGFGRGSFNLQGSALIFARATGNGEACELVSGLCQAVLEGYDKRPLLLVHNACEARGNQRCRWAVTFQDDDPGPGAVPAESERASPAPTDEGGETAALSGPGSTT